MQIHHFMVVDFEATCSDSQEFPREEMEIIEVGAVMVEADTLETVSEFQSFVRPVRHKFLTTFCQKLTTIEQSDVDAADEFGTVLQSFESWAARFPNLEFCSWGAYDRNQLAQDCSYHGLEAPNWPHRNLKKLFINRQALGEPCGMDAALRKVGIELQGTHHRGIDDARNIAKLLPYCF